MAKATEDYLEGSARKAETYLGWKRHTVKLDLQKRRTGLVCVDNYRARGRQKTEEHLPQLSADIHALIGAQSQADPALKTTFIYTKVRASSVLTVLITAKGYCETDLPCRQTIGTMLNRLGYGLKNRKK